MYPARKRADQSGLLRVNYWVRARRIPTPHTRVRAVPAKRRRNRGGSTVIGVPIKRMVSPMILRQSCVTTSRTNGSYSMCGLWQEPKQGEILYRCTSHPRPEVLSEMKILLASYVHTVLRFSERLIHFHKGYGKYAWRVLGKNGQNDRPS